MLFRLIPQRLLFVSLLVIVAGEIHGQNQKSFLGISSVDFIGFNGSVQLNYFSFDSFQRNAKNPNQIKSWETELGSHAPNATLTNIGFKFWVDSKKLDNFRYSLGFASTQQLNELFTSWVGTDTTLYLINDSRFLTLQLGVEQKLGRGRFSISSGVGLFADLPVGAQNRQDILVDSTMITTQVFARNRAQFGIVLPATFFVKVTKRASFFTAIQLISGLGYADGSPLRLFGAGINFGMRWTLLPDEDL